MANVTTEKQALEAIQAADLLAERLALTGDLQGSAMAFLLRQTIRAIWTELHHKTQQPVETETG